MLVKKRVEEELEKRKDEIEQEVARRVEAAKIQMEREMMIELEKRREAAREEERKREVIIINYVDTFSYQTNNLAQIKHTNRIKIPILSLLIYFTYFLIAIRVRLSFTWTADALFTFFSLFIIPVWFS